MKRLLFASLLSAVIGGGVVVGIVAATVGLNGKTEKIVTRVQAQPYAPSNASQTSSGLTPHEIYEKDAPGVVYVQSTIVHRSESSPFFFGGEAEEGTASGSGIEINDHGLILTNFHVIENAVKVVVKFSETGNSVEAKVIGKDPSKDLALLKVPTAGVTFHPLKLGNSESVEVGDPVLAIGNPFNLDRTLTTGVVSALQRRITAPNGFTIENVIQTDAPINPGNSGGPLLNAAGEVIGINSQIETSGNGSDGNIGIGFAIPINTAKKELPLLEKGETIRGAYLGVRADTIESCLSATLNVPSKGALIEYVEPGTPAAKAGLRAGSVAVRNSCEGEVTIGGDVVIGIGGKKIETSTQLAKTIEEKKPGQTIAIEVMAPTGHGKYEKKTVEATLTQRPNKVNNPSIPEG